MAGRAAIMLALGIPVAAGLLYLVLGSAPLAYPLANALALLIAVPIAAFAPLRLAEREQRVLTLVLLALLFVPLVSGPHLGTVARWLPLGPVNLHTGALALPALVVLAARDEDYAPPILLAALLAASLQPDAATALAVMMAAVGLYNAGQDWRMVPVAGIAFLASIGAVLRGELPAQPFVERVLVDLALREPLAALGLGKIHAPCAGGIAVRLFARGVRVELSQRADRLRRRADPWIWARAGARAAYAPGLEQRD